MAKGWIKLHRGLMDSDIWNEGKFSPAQAWIDLILMANYKSGDLPLPGKSVKLEIGDVFTSQAKLAERWKWARKTVRRFLIGLEKAEMCTIKGTIRGPIGYTHLNITKYKHYQTKGDDDAHSSAHLTTHLGPISDSLVTHIQEGKNVKKERREEGKESRPAYLIRWSESHHEFMGINCKLCEAKKDDVRHECGFQKLKDTIRERYKEMGRPWMRAVLENMERWVEDNPDKEKKDWRRFILNWYRREAQKKMEMEK